jgi:hypothetical protein
MNNEPVAIRYDFDGYGYRYMDSGSGSDWQTRVEGEPLYTHPAKEITDMEIIQIANQFKNLEWAIVAFARAILRKAHNE